MNRCGGGIYVKNSNAMLCFLQATHFLYFPFPLASEDVSDDNACK